MVGESLEGLCDGDAYRNVHVHFTIFACHPSTEEEPTDAGILMVHEAIRTYKDVAGPRCAATLQSDVFTCAL